jgi:threonyl-tRNA synthetase
MSSNTVSLRARHKGDVGPTKLDEFITSIKEEIKSKK